MYNATSFFERYLQFQTNCLSIALQKSCTLIYDFAKTIDKNVLNNSRCMQKVEEEENL